MREMNKDKARGSLSWCVTPNRYPSEHFVSSCSVTQELDTVGSSIFTLLNLNLHSFLLNVWSIYYVIRKHTDVHPTQPQITTLNIHTHLHEGRITSQTSIYCQTVNCTYCKSNLSFTYLSDSASDKAASRTSSSIFHFSSAFQMRFSYWVNLAIHSYMFI